MKFSSIFAQDHPNSPVYRDYKYSDTSSIFKRVNDSFKLWQSYLLIREANNGNIFAQHELGIRYLTGKGFPADTVKGFLWIKKAADKNLTAAHYNLGILYYNGWGTDWNPFQAYKHFKTAAENRMPEAEYIIGLTYIDNLILPRNTERAYIYLKKAADKNYKPAEEILREFQKKEFFFVSDSIQVGHNKNFFQNDSTTPGDQVEPATGITYLNPADTLETDDVSILKELVKSGLKDLQKAFGITRVIDSSFVMDSTALTLIKTAADDGSPEALVLLGRCYEKGIEVNRNIISAAAHYIRSIRLDSQRGRKLLIDLLNNVNLQSILKNEIQKKNPEAEFVAAGLTALEFNSQLLKNDALNLLKHSASKYYLPALVELGYCYFTGNMVEQDKQKAIEVWREGSALKSSEADVRIAIANLQDNFIYEESTKSITTLSENSEKGNLLAQVALAYCYESGKGVTKSQPDAVMLYRTAAVRGSQGAYNALKRMYNDIRPDEDEFIILDN